jgi:hypothetical protein
MENSGPRKAPRNVGNRKRASKWRMIIQAAKELEACQAAYVLAMSIFGPSKRLPAEPRGY